ncbi:F-box/LRR-repeat protein 3 [Cephus cinctus]|uniref:F-box/LRR-repeat protein 3 n=1 Tax=Cephus cinctus TaxID=211228 RepID=A0AAJ7FP49_CEPCN|nr:F-box/LRR-repeat protein 3 [Cephus cinctus]
MNCPLNMLELINVSKSSFFYIDCNRFTSSLTIAFDRSPLRSLMIDHTPVNDPSLTNLASNTSSTLHHLRMSCPRLSPKGILKLANGCSYLRELSISYSVLSNELLMALSDKEHVHLEILCIEAHGEGKSLPLVSDKAWQSLAKHSPNIKITLLCYLAEEEDYESLFLCNFPVTNLYFGNYVPASVFMKIGKSCPRLVELIVSAHGADFIDQGLLSVARCCSKLRIVGLGDCKLTCSGLAEFVRLLGNSLRELYIWEISLIDDSKCDTNELIAKVSSLLGRTWTPEYVPLW